MKAFYLFMLLLIHLPLSGQLGSQPSVAEETEIDPTTYTGTLTGTFPNGVLKFRKELINGKANGLWLEWLPNGTLRYRAWWKDGFGHGKWEYFYPNGQLRSVGIYEKDLPIGLHQEFYSNGQISRETPYINGKREGIVNTWAETGIPTGKQQYAANKRVLDLPVLFQPGLVATKKNNEWGLTFTPGGDTLYFARRDAGTENKGIYTAIKKKGNWTNPTLATFSRIGEDSPFISADGRRLYTETTMPLPDSKVIENNLWYRNREGTGWSAPVMLGPNINGVTKPGDKWPANYEAGPVTDPKGNLYYWSKGKNTNGARIYSAHLKEDGNFTDPVELPSPIFGNASSWESSPVISPDGNYLLFASYNRGGGFGGEDIYYSKRTTDGGWTVPQNLGPAVNSSREESFPRFSPDGKYFYFSSDRAGNLDNKEEPTYSIYYMETRFLQVN